MCDSSVSVVEAVTSDLAALSVDVSGSALAATALVLAVELDDQDVSATAKAACARVLAETMESLRVLAGAVKQPGDKLDELNERRQTRIRRAVSE